MVGAFRKGEFELLALAETKLKGNGEGSWCGVNGIIARVVLVLLGGQGACARVVLILRECIWNMPAVCIVLPDTGSLGSLPRQLVYPPV